MTTNFKSRARNTFSQFKNELEDGEWSISLIFAILCFCGLFALTLKLIFNNVEPFAYLIGGEMPTASNIPFVGLIWDVLNLFYYAFGATVAWAFINICEVIWIFIALDRKAHRSAIREMQREQELHEKQGQGLQENSYSRRLKRKGLKIPFFFIEWSPIIAIAALVVDVIVNWHRYPVITSWTKFLGGLMIGKVIGIDWENLKAIAWNLTSFEILVVLLIIVGQWIAAHRSA